MFKGVHFQNEKCDCIKYLKLVDPACGTAGFLVSASEYIRKHYESCMNYEQWEHLGGNAFTGFDTDRTILRISAMNLMLHSISHPEIDYKDSISKQNAISNKFTICLANPPFKGTVNAESIRDDLKAIVNTKKRNYYLWHCFCKCWKKADNVLALYQTGYCLVLLKRIKQSVRNW